MIKNLKFAYLLLICLFLFTFTTVTAQETPKQPEESQEEPLLFPERFAQFPGSDKEFYAFLANNVKYPANALENNVEGNVFLQFIVNKDGSLEDIKVVKSAHPDLDAEAIRVIKAMPNWVPAKQNGKPVRSYVKLPIKFSLK